MIKSNQLGERQEEEQRPPTNKCKGGKMGLAWDAEGWNKAMPVGVL